MTVQLERRRQRSVWRNVNARFPGFTEIISEHYWRHIDPLDLKIGDPEIARTLLAKFSDGVEVNDLADDGASININKTSNNDKVTIWMKSVLEYHSSVYSILDGDVLIPLNMSIYINLIAKAEKEKKEILERCKEIESINSKNESYSRSIEDEDPKRIKSIYNIIYIMASKKYQYKGTENSSAVTNIQRSFEESGYTIDRGTIHGVLKSASEHFYEKPPRSSENG